MSGIGLFILRGSGPIEGSRSAVRTRWIRAASLKMGSGGHYLRCGLVEEGEEMIYVGHRVA